MSFPKSSLLQWSAKGLIAIAALVAVTAAAQQTVPTKTQPSLPANAVKVQPAAGSPAPTGAQPPAASTSASLDPGASLPPDTPVMTINNVCSADSSGSGSSQPSSGGCKTVITKAEFEKLVGAGSNQTALPPAARMRVAQPFAQTVLFDAIAKKRGIDKDPEVENFLKVTQMSALARALQQQLVQKAQQVTPQQITEYYQHHQRDFEEAKVSRLFIPKIAASQNIDPAKAKTVAEQLQKDAAAGKSMEDLEKQAYTELSLQQTPPRIDMGVLRRTGFPEAHQEAVFSLSVDQVTPVLEDANAFYVYKVESKTIVPETNVSNEIKTSIAKKNYSEELHSIFDPAEATLNPDYFGGMKNIDWNASQEGEGRAAPPTPRAPGRPTSTPPPTRQPQ